VSLFPQRAPLARVVAGLFVVASESAGHRAASRPRYRPRPLGNNTGEPAAPRPWGRAASKRNRREIDKGQEGIEAATAAGDAAALSGCTRGSLYQAVPEDREARAAAVEGFAQVLPEMPAEDAAGGGPGHRLRGPGARPLVLAPVAGGR
jgi:hypothetical protein